MSGLKVRGSDYHPIFQTEKLRTDAHLPEVKLGHVYWTYFFAEALRSVPLTVGWAPWKSALPLWNRGGERSKGVELPYAGEGGFLYSQSAYLKKLLMRLLALSRRYVIKKTPPKTVVNFWVVFMFIIGGLFIAKNTVSVTLDRVRKKCHCSSINVDALGKII